MNFFGIPFGRRVAPVGERVEPVLAAAVDRPPAPPAWMGDVGFSGGGGGRGRPHVRAATADRHATVMACCNVISGDLAKLPLRVYREPKPGKFELVEGHPLDRLLNGESSPGVPARVMRYALNYSYVLRGRAHAYAPRDGVGEVELLEAILPDGVSMLTHGRDRFYDFTDGAGVLRRVPLRAMVHLRFMALDGWTARSPLEVAAESVLLAFAGQSAAMDAATGERFKGFAKLGSFSSPDDEQYERDRERLRHSLREEQGGFPIIGPEDEIKRLDMSSADLELLASRKFDREQLAAIYRVPPSKLQMLEHGVKANGEQQAIDYKADCLTHWGGQVEAQMGVTLLTPGERAAGLRLVHDYDALLEATTAERYEAHSKAVGGPFKTINEARLAEGLPPIEGGDVLLPPPNMTRDAGDKKPNKGGDDA